MLFTWVKYKIRHPRGTSGGTEREANLYCVLSGSQQWLLIDNNSEWNNMKEKRNDYTNSHVLNTCMDLQYFLICKSTCARVSRKVKQTKETKYVGKKKKFLVFFAVVG